MSWSSNSLLLQMMILLLLLLMIGRRKSSHSTRRRHRRQWKPRHHTHTRTTSHLRSIMRRTPTMIPGIIILGTGITGTAGGATHSRIGMVAISGGIIAFSSFLSTVMMFRGSLLIFARARGGGVVVVGITIRGGSGGGEYPAGRQGGASFVAIRAAASGIAAKVGIGSVGAGASAECDAGGAAAGVGVSDGGGGCIPIVDIVDIVVVRAVAAVVVIVMVVDGVIVVGFDFGNIAQCSFQTSLLFGIVVFATAK